MYVWIGLGTSEDAQAVIRAYCRQKNSLGVSEVAFSLPQHISLKTSFDTERQGEIIRYLLDGYGHLPSLTARVAEIRRIPGIIWLQMEENLRLRAWHRELNRELAAHFDIPLTGFDGESFTFHSTLFQDPAHSAAMDDLFRSMEDHPFAGMKLPLDRLYIGLSPDGQVGTYRVVEEVMLA